MLSTKLSANDTVDLPARSTLSICNMRAKFPAKPTALSNALFEVSAAALRKCNAASKRYSLAAALAILK